MLYRLNYYKRVRFNNDSSIMSVCSIMKEMINYKRKTLVKCPRRARLQLLLHLIVDTLDYLHFFSG